MSRHNGRPNPTVDANKRRSRHRSAMAFGAHGSRGRDPDHPRPRDHTCGPRNRSTSSSGGVAAVTSRPPPSTRGGALDASRTCNRECSSAAGPPMDGPAGPVLGCGHTTSPGTDRDLSRRRAVEVAPPPPPRVVVVEVVHDLAVNHSVRIRGHGSATCRRRLLSAPSGAAGGGAGEVRSPTSTASTDHLRSSERRPGCVPPARACARPRPALDAAGLAAAVSGGNRALVCWPGPGAGGALELATTEPADGRHAGRRSCRRRLLVDRSPAADAPGFLPAPARPPAFAVLAHLQRETHTAHEVR
jgi:hypothetical protein